MIKSYRQKLILEIIAQREIETQSQLMQALEQAGVSSTQATVSRDIKELRLVKAIGPGETYHYTAGEEKGGVRSEADPRLRTIFREGAVSTVSAQNLIVVKTLPGLAQAVCSAIDAMEIEGLLGSLGGDDTAFVVMRDSQAAERAAREFEEMMEGAEDSISDRSV